MENFKHTEVERKVPMAQLQKHQHFANLFHLLSPLFPPLVYVKPISGILLIHPKTL